MLVPRKEFTGILSLLKKNPRGLNIGEIAHTIGLNRISTAKYLDILAALGTIEVREMGKAKLYYISRAIPASVILTGIPGYIVVIDRENRVIYANDRFVTFCGLIRDKILDTTLETIPCDLIHQPDVQKTVDAAWETGKHFADFEFESQNGLRQFSLDGSRVRLHDTSECVVLSFEDITRYRHIAGMPKNQGNFPVSLANKSKEILFFTDAEGIILEIMAGAGSNFPAAREFVSRHLNDFLPGIWAECGNGRQESSGLVKIPDISGISRTFEWYVTRIAGTAGKEAGFSGILLDVTERENLRKNYKILEEQRRYFLENSEDWIWESDEKWQFSFSNGAIRKMLGYFPDDILGRFSLYDLLFPKDKDDLTNLVEGIKKTRVTVQDLYLTLRHRNGTPVIVQCRVSPKKDDTDRFAGYRGICRDITCQCNSEERIRALACEKDFLFSEIQHRVKNNLQVILSLLFLQANQTREPGTKEALSELQNRVWAIALVYELVSETADANRISLPRYIAALTKSLSETYVSKNRTEIVFDLNTDEIGLDLDTAIPLGVVLNELVTNSLLHAFTRTDSGRITISAKTGRDPEVSVFVSDNGCGLPEEFSFKDARSLGFRLVKNLVDQIGGTIDHVPGTGCVFKISFPVKPACCPDAVLNGKSRDLSDNRSAGLSGP